MNLSMKQRQNHRHREQTVVAGGRRVRKGRSGSFGISRCKLVYIAWMNNKVLLYRIGNCIQHPVINHSGKEHEKEYI